MPYKYFDGNWHAYVSYSLSSIGVDRVANTRTVRLDLSFGLDSGWSIEFSNTYGAYIGVQIGSQTKYLYLGELWLYGSSKSLGSVEFTFSHDDDGSATRTINIWSGSTSGIVYNDLYLGSLDASFTETFKKIPRMSQIASVSGGRRLGSEVTVTLDKKVE